FGRKPRISGAFFWKNLSSQTFLYFVRCFDK
ncbi:MAG: hypothetical protein ACI9ZT_000217, partial [Gammaproteobacteria bacterium]